MSVNLSKIKFNTIKEYIVKYIILKIQSQEWEKGASIPSERWFMIKFNVSKSMISSILNSLKQQNILYSISKKGYFITEHEYAFLASASKFYNSTNIQVKKVEKQLTEKDVKTLNLAFKQQNMNQKISSEHFKCYIKKYYKKNKLGRVAYMYIKRGKEIDDEALIIKDSIFKMIAYCGVPLVKKMELHSIVGVGEVFPNFDNNMNEHLKNIVDCTYEVFWNYENDLSLIIKVFVNPNVDNYYSPRLFNLLQK